MASLVISCCKSQLPNIKTKMAEKMPIAVHATICTVRRSTKFIGRSSGGGRGGSGGVLGGGGSYGGEVGGKGGGGEGGGEGEQPAVVSWLHDDHEELRKAGLAEKVKAIRARLHWPRELVPVKVSSRLVACDVSQASGWSKAAAPRNVECMSVTREVFHASGWLKAAAYRKVLARLVAREVSQFNGRLKNCAPRKADSKVVPWDVSHPLISSLKLEQAALQLLKYEPEMLAGADAEQKT